MTNSADDRSATDPRVLMLRLVFEFLLQQNYFGSAAMMVAEHLSQILRIEAAESSGNLSTHSLGTASGSRKSRDSSSGMDVLMIAQLRSCSGNLPERECGSLWPIWQLNCNSVIQWNSNSNDRSDRSRYPGAPWWPG